MTCLLKYIKCKMCFIFVAVGSNHDVNTFSSSFDKGKNVAHPFSVFERGKPRTSMNMFLSTSRLRCTSKL